MSKTINNLTNPGKDPVAGDEIEERYNGLTVRYTHADNTITAEDEARSWRNMELLQTDWIMSVTDHPQLEAFKAYRIKLRDWPATEDFPDEKPTL